MNRRLLVLLLLSPLALFSADWPQWRGVNRDGVAAGARLPGVWPEKLPLRWVAPSGSGYSTPVVAAGRVYFLERDGENEIARALDAETGREIWRTPYAAPYTVHPYASKHGDCPKATTTVAGGQVFSFGISGILCAFDSADGKVLWKRDLGAEFRSVPLFGASASPLVEAGLVILPVGHKDSGGALMAFRAATGETAWKSVKDGPSYASAIACDLAEVRQVVCFTAKHFVGVALADGEELWSYPIELPFDETIVTPVVWRDRVIFSGRSQGGTRAVRVYREDRKADRVGQRVLAEEVWKKDAPVYMTSPVVSGDGYFALEHGTGRLFCLKLEDGSLAWKETETTFGDYASLVLATDRILVLDSGGTLTVIEASAAAFKKLASYRVAETPTYAHLVVVGSRLLVRDASRIQCFDFEESQAPAAGPKTAARDRD